MEEIKAGGPETNVEVVGINRSGQASNNALVTSTRVLPWLQDSDEVGQWASWGATWRDVRIVSSKLELDAVYNLTAHDLNVPDNRATMKRMLMEAVTASQVDEDGDGLRDDWEAAYFGELASEWGGEDDPDQDGYSNRIEYAFGSHPLRADSLPQPGVVDFASGEEGSSATKAVAFWIRAGSSIDYVCQQSNDLQTWTNVDPESGTLYVRHVFDGRGVALMVCAPEGPQPVQSHFRVQVGG